MLQVASWNEVVILLTFDLKVGETRGLLEYLRAGERDRGERRQFLSELAADTPGPTPQEAAVAHREPRPRPLPVTADVQTRCTTRELLNLPPGHVLSLGVPVETDVNVRVGNIVKFTGRLATASGRAAVRVNRGCAVAAGVWEEGQG